MGRVECTVWGVGCAVCSVRFAVCSKCVSVSVKLPDCSVMHGTICSDCRQCPVCIMLHAGYMAAKSSAVCSEVQNMCSRVCSAYSGEHCMQGAF